jgi:hypothetical protein
MKPRNFEEKVVWYCLLLTYPLYFAGLLAGTYTIAAWVLAGYAIFRLWIQAEEIPEAERIQVPIGLWVWFVGLMMLATAVVIGHVDFGNEHLVPKGLINHILRTWSFFTVAPLIAVCLKIRPQLLYRAVCILCVQSLVIGFYCFLATKVSLPLPYYTFPSFLAKVGGTPIVSLVAIDEYITEKRVSLYAPWPPAMGLFSAVFMCLAYQEKNYRWKWLAILGCILSIWTSGSRAGQVCLLIVPVATLLISSLHRISTLLLLGVGGFFAGIFSSQIHLFFRDAVSAINDQRADSSALRQIISRMTRYRWRTEAFWWGHGIPLDELPPILQEKPLGSHNTWDGLLYYQGLVGLLAVAIPLVWSFGEFAIKAQHSKEAQAALAVLIALLIYTNSEDIDFIAAYYWPGLLVMGYAYRDRFFPQLDPLWSSSVQATSSAGTSKDSLA